MAKVYVSSTFLDLKDCRNRVSLILKLSQHYRDDEQTLPLIQDRAVKDESPSADDPDTVYYPHEVALEALAKYWPTHPDTLPLLRERAENDPTEWLRERARKLADELEASE